MTTTPKNGGPAFPRPGYTDATGDWPVSVRHEAGMTLRDYFAGQALIGIMGDMERALSEVKATRQASMPDFFAGAAYRYADAMLKARETDND
jgi:hypothetical protein